MKNLNILIVEGNTQEENLKLQKLSNQPQSFNFRNNILKYYPDAVIDIVHLLQRMKHQNLFLN